MAAFLCGQDVIAPDECIECGGVPGPHGRYCTEDCAGDAAERCTAVDIAGHLHVRDLLCDCSAVCAPRGLPTQAQRDEYTAEASAR